MLHYTEYAIMSVLSILSHLNLIKKTPNTPLLYCFLILVVSWLGHRTLKSLIHGAQPDLRWQPSLVWFPIVFVPHTTKKAERENQVFLNIMRLRNPKTELHLGVWWTILSSEECCVFRRTICRPDTNVPSSPRRLWTGDN